MRDNLQSASFETVFYLASPSQGES
jgi:hypothetical protein